MRQGKGQEVVQRITLEWSDGRIEYLDGNDAVRWWSIVNTIVRMHIISNPSTPERRNFGGKWKRLAGPRLQAPRGCGVTGPIGPCGADDVSHGPRGVNGPAGPGEYHGEEEE